MIICMSNGEDFTFFGTCENTLNIILTSMSNRPIVVGFGFGLERHYLY